MSFSCTISKANLHDLANIFALAQRYRVDQVMFYEEDPESPGREAFRLEPADRAVLEAQLPRIEASGVRFSNDLHFRGRHPAAATPGAVHCNAPWKVFFLRADGLVRTCCTLRASMGDLRNSSFEELWNGREYVALRRALTAQSRLPEACLTCTDPLRHYDE